MNNQVFADYEYASLAVQHFTYAGMLSGLFALVAAVYLVAMWGVAGKLEKTTAFLIHTLFLLWQSNVAFVAVVCLAVGVHNQSLAGQAMELWNVAPLMVPASAILYALILALCLAIVWRRGSSSSVTPPR
jgi:hypothetical protein